MSATSTEGADLLEQPLLSSGDPGAALAALVMQVAHQSHKDDQQIRRSEEQMMERAQDAQVKEMHDRADTILVRGVVSGACSAAAGAVSMAGSVQGGSHATLGHALKGSADIAAAQGKAWDGYLESKAEHGNARATDDEHAADRAKRRADDARDGAEQDQKLVEKALDFYREYMGAKAQAMAAARHRA